MSGFTKGKPELVVVVGLNNQVEPILFLPIQSLRDGQLTGVRMDLEMANGGSAVQEVGDLKTLVYISILSFWKDILEIKNPKVVQICLSIYFELKVIVFVFLTRKNPKKYKRSISKLKNLYSVN